ncbi:MAG: hypothetical protein PHQ19_03310, partial [Candidatus Krumholzibacteria bacterium]|nr:hypothetical protein [Candidatus Krumholzibacteria bacterium]
GSEDPSQRRDPAPEPQEAGQTADEPAEARGAPGGDGGEAAAAPGAAQGPVESDTTQPVLDLDDPVDDGSGPDGEDDPAGAS